MSYAETIDHTPQAPALNAHGRQVVDQVLAVHNVIVKEMGTSMDIAAKLTLAVFMNAGTGTRLIHDPSDPMSRAG